MSTTFDLPDLGEGLADAEIVAWHVKEGDQITAEAPLVSVETAKAVVDIPSPYGGRVVKLHARAGDVVEVHKPLVDFEVEGEEASAPQAAAPATAAPPAAPPRRQTQGATAKDAGNKESIREDSGTVVGSMPVSDGEVEERFVVRRRARGEPARPKAAPAARARAKALGVELAAVAPSGHRGQITPRDVERHAAHSAQPPAAPAAGGAVRPVRYDEAEPLRGPRRFMAQTMSFSRDQVTPTSLFDDADIHGWGSREDITVRVVRALVAACRTEPALNAWFDSEAVSRTLHQRIDLALAVDTADGLIVPVVRGVDGMNAETLRGEFDRVKRATRERTVTPQDMLNPTITLSNFGMMAGRYASPVIVPPQVAIVGTGGVRHDVVPVLGGIEVHRRLPLSVTFDHRCVTGGEACRFLGAMIEDLERTD